MAFDQSIADLVCERLTAGESMVKACEAAGVARTTVLGWLDDPANKAFADSYAQARARGYLLLADEIISISDDASGDVVQTEDGPKANAEFVARSRLRVDARKWMLAKMLPKIYGDKLTHAGDPDAPLVFEKIVREIVKPK